MPLALFHTVLSGARVVVGLDLATYFYPYRVYAARALSQGRLPLWNPDLYAGVPFVANIQTAVFYPPNLLFVVLPQAQAINWLTLFHLALGGLLFYAFSRRALELSRVGAIVGGLVFSAGGFALTQTDHLNQSNVLAWMPGVVLAVDQAYRRRSRRWLALLAAFVALQVFAGHPQELYYTAVISASWLLMLLVRGRRDRLGLSLRRLAFPLAGALIGAALAAVQVVPTLELSRLSIRAGALSYQEANLLALPYHQLLAAILPDYVSAVPVEWAAAIGMTAAVLAILALLRRWRDPATITLAALAIIALLLSLGAATPIFWLAYHLVPGYASFRVPPRALAIFAFAAAGLAGIGATEVERDGRRAVPAWTVIAVAAVVIIGAFPLAWWLQRHGPIHLLDVFLPVHRYRMLAKWALVAGAATAIALVARRLPVAAIALVALVAAELYLAARPLDALRPLPAGVYALDGRIDAAVSAAGGVRSLSIATLPDKKPPVPQAELQRLGLGNDFRYANLASARVIDAPNYPMQAGRATLDGYDGGLLPLTSYLNFRALLLPEGANNPDVPLVYEAQGLPDPRLLSLLGVGAIVHDAGSALPPDAGLLDGPAIEGVQVARNPAALPAAFVVHRAEVAASETSALATVADSSFDVAQAAVISAPCGTAAPSAAEPDHVQVLRTQPEDVAVDVSTTAAGVLVVDTVDYPGWRASVDRTSAPVVSVDGLLQGVCLPAGHHLVELRFVPTHWTGAIALSLAALLLLLGVLLAPAPLLRRLLPRTSTEPVTRRA